MMAKTFIIAFFISILAGALPAFADIELNISNQTGIVDDTIQVEIDALTDFTDEDVLAYQLEISYNNNYFEPISATIEGTISQEWGNLQVNMTNPGTVKLSAAGTQALSGTGALVYISFRLLRQGNVNMSFANTGYNMLNEGMPELILSNGSIDILDKPHITLSPNTGKIAIGKTMSFNCSGGEAPYVFSVSDNNIAAISETGILTGTQKGLVYVIAEDQNGVIDSTDNMIQIVPFELSIRDTSYYQNQHITIPVNISSLEVENITSGQLSIGFNSTILTPESIITDASILTQADNVESNLTDNGKVRLSFASSEALSGSGPLFFIRFKIADRTSGSTGIVIENALFNEDAEALYHSGTFSILGLPELNVTPKTFTLFTSEQVTFEVTGGSPPYIWSISDPALASITEEGLLNALSGGDIVVTATDVNGATGSSNIISIYDGELTIEDASGPNDGTPFMVAVNISPSSIISQLTSFSGKTPLNPAKIKTITINKETTISDSWISATNIVDNFFKFAMAGTVPSADTDVLFFLETVLHPEVVIDEVVPVRIEQQTANEGSPRLLVSHGSITITESTGIQSTKSIEFRMYPNPANEIFYFSGELEVSHLSILDMTGRTIMSKHYPVAVFEDKLLVSALEKGLYIVCLKTTTKNKYHKLYIE